MPRVRTEIEVDEELIDRAERHAERSGRPRNDIIEEALRRGLDAGPSLVEIASEIWERSDLTGEEAMEIARAETDAVRAARRDTKPGTTVRGQATTP
jgi:predicted transcriptional regulator